MPDEGEQQAGWLPPEPPGAEPELGQPPQPPPPPPLPAAPQQPQQQPPPTAGYQQPYQQPPGYYQQPGYQYYPVQPEPGNGNAVAALVLSLVGAGILLTTIGLGFILSIPCGALAIFFGHKGRDAVDSGKTSKNRGLAQAGFIIGIVTVVLSILAAAGWIAVIASDPDFFDNLDKTDETNPFNFQSALPALPRIAFALARLTL